MTSSPPCWSTKTKDLSLASFVGPPEVVHFSIVVGVSRGRFKTSYSLIHPQSSAHMKRLYIKLSFKEILLNCFKLTESHSGCQDFSS